MYPMMEKKKAAAEKAQGKEMGIVERLPGVESGVCLDLCRKSQANPALLISVPVLKFIFGSSIFHTVGCAHDVSLDPCRLVHKFHKFI